MEFFWLYRITPSREWYLSVPSMADEPVLESYMRGDVSPGKAVPVELHNTKKVDMLLCAGEFFATAKVIDLLRTHKFTGWDTYDVKVTNAKPNIPQIFGLVFKGRLGDYIPDQTIKVSDWDGTDFCTFNAGDIPIVTQRVVEAFEINKIMGVKYRPMKVVP